MTPQLSKKLAARVGHKKSRTGCFKCRSRRVKCDEITPVCTNCQRLGLPCQYPNKSSAGAAIENTPTSSKAKTKQACLVEQTTDASPSSTNLFTPFSTPLSSSGSEHASTSRGSHMELRLLHAFMGRAIGLSTTIHTTPEWLRVWFVEMPLMAFEHDNILYALLTFSATQLLGTPTAGPEISVAQAEYWSLALQHQRAALSDPDSNMEVVTLAAVLIAQSSFGMLRGRVLEPYTPPVAWFEVSRSAWRVSPRAESMSASSNVWKTIVEATAPIWLKWGREKPTFVENIYAPILTYMVPEEFDHYGGNVVAGLNAYKQTLALLTSFREALASQEFFQSYVWRICIIAQTIPDDFVHFLRQKRPRALLITAAIFSIISRTKVLRIFGDADSSIPRSEIQAIQKVLPQEWQILMSQPLEDLALSIG